MDEHLHAPQRDLYQLVASTVGGAWPPPPEVKAQVPGLNVLHHGQDIVIRGLQGRYIAARKTKIKEVTVLPSAVAEPQRASFNAQANGIGAGDKAETLAFRHIAAKEQQGGPVRYGDTVALRSHYAEESLLGIETEDEFVTFQRSVPKNIHRWQLVWAGQTGAKGKGKAAARALLGVQRPAATEGQEESKEGQFVEAGDAMCFRHELTKGLLCLVETDGEMELGVCSEDVPTDQQPLAVWEVFAAGTPYTPIWTKNRPYLAGHFLLCDNRHETPDRALGQLSQAANGGPVPPLTQYNVLVQEHLLLDDLLYALMGLEGRYIRATNQGGGLGAALVIDSSSMNPSMAVLAERFLPLCHSYMRIKQYVTQRARPEYGLVAHAFVAGVKLMLKEYLVLVAQLEHQLIQGKLTLQKLYFYVLPTIKTMEALDLATQRAASLRGGALLNSLRDPARAGGDAKVRQLHVFLLQRAARPYFDMLARWIYHGQLDDPYKEFMVQEQGTLYKEQMVSDYNAKYWVDRYLLQEDMVCSFLQDHKHHILTTGKYLNVVRECGKAVDCPFAGPIQLDFGSSTVAEASYGKVIEEAYGYSSRILLELVMREYQLLARLSSIKHYFFLDQGDYFTQFMDVAHEELNKVVAQIPLVRLNSLLNIAVQMSSAATDPFREDITCSFATKTLLEHLAQIHNSGHSTSSRAPLPPAPPEPEGTQKGIAMLTMEYNVEFPLTLILSHKSFTKYQLVFRLLSLSKHVARTLSNTWLDHQGTKELSLQHAMLPTYQLRQRMLHFMQNLVYYTTFEVIEPRWHELMANLRKARTVDEVIAKHDEFQDATLKECLLTNYLLMQVLMRLMTSCLLFAAFMEQEVEPHFKLQEEAARAAEAESAAMEQGGPRTRRPLCDSRARRQKIEHRSDYMRQVLSTPSYISQLAELDRSFEEHLHQFMMMLWADSHAQNTTHLSNLWTRLDYNAYLSDKYEINTKS